MSYLGIPPRVVAAVCTLLAVLAAPLVVANVISIENGMVTLVCCSSL